MVKEMITRRRGSLSRICRVLVGGVAAALVVTPAALGGGYISNGGGAQGDVESGVGGAASAGSLPFTGLDLALIVVGGMALLVTGFLLRRAGRSRDASN